MERPFIGLIIVLLIGLFLLVGCTGDSGIVPENPQEISFSYGSGAMHLDWGSFEVKVDSLGVGTLTKKMGEGMELQKSFSVTEAELKDVYVTAYKSGFFSLNESYDDPFIMDGGWSRITINYDEKTKTVLMKNYFLQQFDTVELKISSLIIKKLGANAFDLSEFRNLCPQKEGECKSFIMSANCDPDAPSEVSEECFVCLDWFDYCDWEE